MRILHFVNQYAPHIGGMENVVQELAERTARKGHDVSVVTCSFKGARNFEVMNNVKVYRFWPIRKREHPLTMPTMPFKLFFLLKHDTVVHIHFTFDYFTASFVFLVAKMKGCRMVTHIHIDPPIAGILRFFMPYYKIIMWRKVLPWCDYIICTTKDYCDLAHRNGMPAYKCALIPIAIDTKKFKRKTSTDIMPPVKLLFVGRLNTQKNVPRLLEAFRLFHDRYPSSLLQIVGDGEEKTEIESIIKNDNISDVVLEGELSGDKVVNIYSASDIFVLPSDFESFGLVNLEAMASGLPIIASDIPGLRDLLTGIAMLVNPIPEDFASAMMKLVEDDDLRKKLVSNGFKKVQDYDWDKITDKIIELYKGPAKELP